MLSNREAFPQQNVVPLDLSSAVRIRAKDRKPDGEGQKPKQDEKPTREPGGQRVA